LPNMNKARNSLANRKMLAITEHLSLRLALSRNIRLGEQSHLGKTK